MLIIMYIINREIITVVSLLNILKKRTNSLLYTKCMWLYLGCSVYDREYGNMERWKDESELSSNDDSIFQGCSRGWGWDPPII